MIRDLLHVLIFAAFLQVWQWVVFTGWFMCGYLCSYPHTARQVDEGWPGREDASFTFQGADSRRGWHGFVGWRPSIVMQVTLSDRSHAKQLRKMKAAHTILLNISSSLALTHFHAMMRTLWHVTIKSKLNCQMLQNSKRHSQIKTRQPKKMYKHFIEIPVFTIYN